MLREPALGRQAGGGGRRKAGPRYPRVNFGLVFRLVCTSAMEKIKQTSDLAAGQAALPGRLRCRRHSIIHLVPERPFLRASIFLRKECS
jgi:hypothetical protein